MMILNEPLKGRLEDGTDGITTAGGSFAQLGPIVVSDAANEVDSGEG